MTDIQSLVMQDLEARRQFGIKKYGTALQPFNGREPLRDAYDEALDLCIYLRQAMYEAGVGYDSAPEPMPKGGFQRVFDMPEDSGG